MVLVIARLRIIIILNRINLTILIKYCKRNKEQILAIQRKENLEKIK